MLIFYMCMAIFGTINLIIYVTTQNKHSNSNIAVIYYLTFVANLGHLAVALSANVDEALLSYKVAYVGGCFLLPCLFITILEFCKYKVSRLQRFILYGISTIIYIFILCTEYLPLYYKSVSMEKIGNATVLDKNYGPVHTIYYIILTTYIIAGLGFAIFTIIKNDNISYKNMLVLVAIETISVLLFLIGKLFFNKIEIIPLIYVVSEWLLLYMSRRLNMYDIEKNVANSLEDQRTYGYITFDLNKNYIGCNSVALQFFPELANLRVDFPIKDTSSTFFNTLSSKLDQFNDEELQETYHIKDAYYECTLKPLLYNNKKRGYLIEIIDDTNQQKYINLLNQYNHELNKTIDEKTAHILAMQDKILFTMANMVENRDTNTGGHIFRTSHVVKLLIEEIKKDNIFNYSNVNYNAIIKYAPLHDLGKIGIDDAILRKNGRLTDDEYNIIKTHSQKGADIVKNILDGVEDKNFVQIAYNIACYHHERWDGSGYPNHLSDQNIPLEARIMAIADVYDALVSKRCYKEKMPYDKAYEIIRDSMGTHFDPQLFVYFDRCRTQLEQYYDTQN